MNNIQGISTYSNLASSYQIEVWVQTKKPGDLGKMSVRAQKKASSSPEALKVQVNVDTGNHLQE